MINVCEGTVRVTAFRGCGTGGVDVARLVVENENFDEFCVQ